MRRNNVDARRRSLAAGFAVPIGWSYRLSRAHNDAAHPPMPEFQARPALHITWLAVRKTAYYWFSGIREGGGQGQNRPNCPGGRPGGRKQRPLQGTDSHQQSAARCSRSPPRGIPAPVLLQPRPIA